jgi:hypothetical protein
VRIAICRPRGYADRWPAARAWAADGGVGGRHNQSASRNARRLSGGL